MRDFFVLVLVGGLWLAVAFISRLLERGKRGRQEEVAIPQKRE